jgi:hypothetical protein
MKHFFKWELKDLIYIGKSDCDLPHGFSIDELTNTQLEQINLWYSISIVKGELVLADKSDIVKWIKKIDCRNKIESEYKEHDQINIILSWTEIEKTKMKTYIEACLDEYRTKWKDANFDNLNI